MTTHVPEPVARMTKDIRAAAQLLPAQEIRFIVDSYYVAQAARITAAGQVRASDAEPNSFLNYLAESNRLIEDQIKLALDTYTTNHPVGSWMKKVKGIGPVISAGLLAHIDIEKAPTVGHIWSYAGLVPGVEWKKGQLRPWNATLKTLCWKAGQSFMKVSGSEDAFYGQIYKERKAYEIEKNEKGDYADFAKSILESKNFRGETVAKKAYSEGRLPPAHINARCTRYAVKLFLSHLHYVWYKIHYKDEPPNPYPIAHMGHVHMIEPPHFDNK